MNRIDDHLAAAQQAIDALGIPYIELDYEAALEDPAAAAAALTRFTGHSVTLADMGVEASLNHSTRMGRAGMTVEKVYDVLPKPLRSAVKALTPTWLIHIFFPERRETAK